LLHKTSGMLVCGKWFA